MIASNTKHQAWLKAAAIKLDALTKARHLDDCSQE
jgi:hypothetical protein